MSFIQRIKRKFCRHTDELASRNYEMPFIGYEFYCPKCEAYVAYFAEDNSYMILSEMQHNIAVEEGKKFWAVNQKFKKFD